MRQINPLQMTSLLLHLKKKKMTMSNSTMLIFLKGLLKSKRKRKRNRWKRREKRLRTDLENKFWT